MTDPAPLPDSAPAAKAAPTARHDGWTPQRQRQFCEALAECGSVERAAAAVGMTRETAYRLRRRSSGRAFALAWDAALLLARQRMIDDVFDMAFEGSVERLFREGKLIAEKRRRDPRALLATIERLGSNKALGTPPAKAVAADFEEFLDCLDDDPAEFMQMRAEWCGIVERESLQNAVSQLRAGRRRGRRR